MHRQFKEPIQDGSNAPNEFDARHISKLISQSPLNNFYSEQPNFWLAAIISFPGVQDRLFQERFAMVID